MLKRASKRKVKARLKLGRIVLMRDLIYHDMDSEETIYKYNLDLDFDKETVVRMSRDS